jgi:hypothetical protein
MELCDRKPAYNSNGIEDTLSILFNQISKIIIKEHKNATTNITEKQSLINYIQTILTNQQ